MLTLVRWIPKENAPAAVEKGLMSHNGSALWVFDLNQGYRPGHNIATRNAWLVAYDLDDTAKANIEGRGHVRFPSEEWIGEKAHPAQVIVKDNEVGAYGIGRMRQGITNLHTTARFATKKEVAKALGLSEREVDVCYRPGKTWPQ